MNNEKVLDWAGWLLNSLINFCIFFLVVAVFGRLIGIDVSGSNIWYVVGVFVVGQYLWTRYERKQNIEVEKMMKGIHKKVKDWYDDK